MAKKMTPGEPSPNPNYKGVVTDCNLLINSVVDMRMREYEKSNAEQDERMIDKMDELINIVKKEYTVNRGLILLLYLIDAVMIGVLWFHINA